MFNLKNHTGRILGCVAAIFLLVLASYCYRIETISKANPHRPTPVKTYEYLSNVPLTQAQKEKVTEEGYENAATFYMMCKVIPRAMKEFLELDSLDAVEKALWTLMTVEEQQHAEKELAKLKSRKDALPPF